MTITHPLLRNWLPVILWTGLIVLESAIGSSANTGSLLYRFLTRFLGHIDAATFAVVHHAIRKTGHFIGYGILGLLWFRAFANTFSAATRFKCAVLGVACTFVVGSLDELHQTFSPARTGRFSDVVLDSCGAIVIITAAILWKTKKIPEPVLILIAAGIGLVLYPLVVRT